LQYENGCIRKHIGISEIHGSWAYSDRQALTKMMIPAWKETSARVIIEFVKESNLVHRYIRLTHTRSQVPNPLHGRVPVELWTDFMADTEALAQQHPFAYKPEEGSVFAWCGGYLCIPCIAIGRALGDDGIEYQVWFQKINAMVSKHQPNFGSYGVILSLAGIHGSQWLQLDVASGPAPMAPGYPAGPGMMVAPMFAGPMGPVGPF